MNERKSGATLSEDDAVARARRAFARPKPPRFYKQAAVGLAEGGFTVLLDGKPLRTPLKQAVVMPGEGLAHAVAGEWDGQGEHIDPAAMPLTRLVNTVIDGVAPRRDEVAGEAAAYGESDLLCYRAGEPEELAARQRAQWDPVLDWARDAHGLRFALAEGVVHVPQPAEALAALRALFAALDDFALGGAASMAGLMGSALLALAVAHGRLAPEDAWNAAHVDEDWQISLWGEDAEAAARRAARWQEMRAAALLCRSG